MEAERLAEKLVSWIRDKVSAAGCRGAVVGMSGGIDSSVLAVLCKRAFPDNTLGVIMPCGSQPEDKEHAHLVASRFSISTTEVVLDEVLNALVGILPDYEASPETDNKAQANLKARLRMLTLYYLANQLAYMVAGSGNRSELAVGYFTKFGDGGVDFLPLGNLVKGEVRELARFLGVPDVIIDKPPSAGLWEGQTDEQELGISYDELDKYLLAGEVSVEVRKKIEAMKAASDHKRMTPPVPGS